jgi:hypothetical protein
LKVDTRKFESALKSILVHTSRDVPTVINGAARDIIIQAAKNTYKANPAQIEKELSTGVITRTNSKSGRVLKKPKTIAYQPARKVYLIIAAQRSKQNKPGLNNTDMSRAAQAFIKRRKAAAGFTASVGWQKALLAFGGRGFGIKSMQPGFEQSSAKDGFGVKAQEGRLLAKMVNTASAIEIYGREPLQAAIAAKTDSMLKHLDEKLSKRFREA